MGRVLVSPDAIGPPPDEEEIRGNPEDRRWNPTGDRLYVEGTPHRDWERRRIRTTGGGGTEIGDKTRGPLRGTKHVISVVRHKNPRHRSGGHRGLPLGPRRPSQITYLRGRDGLGCGVTGATPVRDSEVGGRDRSLPKSRSTVQGNYGVREVGGRDVRFVVPRLVSRPSWITTPTTLCRDWNTTPTPRTPTRSEPPIPSLPA